MLLTIITISRWNDEALDRTLKSVDTYLSEFASQNIFEQIVVTSEEGIFTESSCRKFIYLPPKGIYNAMNHGLSKAKGEWVWFLNAGDECAEDIVQLLSVFKDSNSDIISAGVYNIEGDTKIKSFGRLTSPHSGTFYKTEILKNQGGYREDFKIISDRIVFDELRPKSKIRRVNLIVSHFYKDGISSVRSGLILRRKETYKYFLEKPSDILRFYRLVREIITSLKK